MKSCGNCKHGFVEQDDLLLILICEFDGREVRSLGYCDSWEAE